jgi:hypothetical protein
MQFTTTAYTFVYCPHLVNYPTLYVSARIFGLLDPLGFSRLPIRRLKDTVSAKGAHSGTTALDLPI